MYQSFNSTVPSSQLQRSLIKALYEINQGEFSFEEAANPTIPGCKIIFEFGLANATCFNYIDEEEVENALDQLDKEQLEVMDFFCVIRYHKCEAEKNRSLKFDYYFIRTVYNRRAFGVQVYHKKGLRYLSPEDLTQFIFNKINKAADRKILKKATA